MPFKDPKAREQYRKEHYWKNREKYLESSKLWRLANPERSAEKKHESYLRNYEKNYEKNLEYNRNYQKEWYSKDPDYFAKKNKKFAQTPKGKLCVNTASAKRRARKKNAEGSFNKEDIKNLYVTQGGCCYYCRVEIKDKYHIEHMLPLSRGGSNWIDNICLACAPCNFKKRTKTAEEFLSCSFN